MEHMRPEIDLLEQLSADGRVTFKAAVGVFRGDRIHLRRLIAALLTDNLVELAESAPAGMAAMPEWRCRELLRDTEFWRTPQRRDDILELRATPRTAEAFARDSESFFDRLFGDA